MSHRPGARPYTVATTAPRSAVAAACRGALVALRPALDMVCIELDADYRWPDEDTRNAVIGPRVRPRRWSFTRRQRGKIGDIAADLWAADDDQFAAALAIAADTTFAIAIATSGPPPYYVNEIESARLFELTDDELAIAIEYVTRQGQDPTYLIPAS